MRNAADVERHIVQRANCGSKCQRKLRAGPQPCVIGDGFRDVYVMG